MEHRLTHPARFNVTLSASVPGFLQALRYFPAGPTSWWTLVTPGIASSTSPSRPGVSFDGAGVDNRLPRGRCHQVDYAEHAPVNGALPPEVPGGGSAPSSGSGNLFNRSARCWCPGGPPTTAYHNPWLRTGVVVPLSPTTLGSQSLHYPSEGTSSSRLPSACPAIDWRLCMRAVNSYGAPSRLRQLPSQDRSSPVSWSMHQAGRHVASTLSARCPVSAAFISGAELAQPRIDATAIRRAITTVVVFDPLLSARQADALTSSAIGLCDAVDAIQCSAGLNDIRPIFG